MDKLVPHRIAPTDSGDVAVLWRKDGVAPPHSEIIRAHVAQLPNFLRLLPRYFVHISSH